MCTRNINVCKVGAIRHVVVQLPLSEQKCFRVTCLKQRLVPIRAVPAKDTAHTQQTELIIDENVTYLC